LYSLSYGALAFSLDDPFEIQLQKLSSIGPSTLDLRLFFAFVSLPFFLPGGFQARPAFFFNS